VLIEISAFLLSRSQSQMDVDSGIETMEVDDVEIRHDVKRRRVSAFYNSSDVKVKKVPCAI